jgi:transcriptional regulator with XRE-family HTH domain
MQGPVVELIRELMQKQGMSVRKISAQIAHKHGGSALGYTQQINRILNDPDYDPTFSTVEKILAALNCSLWQTNFQRDAAPIADQVTQLSDEVSDLKATVNMLCTTIDCLTKQLNS